MTGTETTGHDDSTTDDATGTDDGAEETFSREYVEKLRRENADAVRFAPGTQR